MLNAKPVSTSIAVDVQLPKLNVQLEVKFPFLRGSRLTALCGYAVIRLNIANAMS